MAASDKNEAAAKKLQKSYFDVLGLCCSSEVPLIEKILKSLDGVKDVSVIVPSKTVIVIHDNLLISQLQIVKALNKARLEANVRLYGEGNYKKKWPSPYTVACGILLALSFLKYVYRPFQWLSLGAVAIGICPIFMRAAAAIRNLTLDVNILVIIAVVGSIALRDYWEAGSIVFLFTIAEWLESRASHKATAVMSSLVNIVPQRAVLAETGEEIDANTVQVNTILAVKAGEIIPIDGIVVQGKCEVDEKTLTGESFPVAKQKESTVWAGTVNLNGYISVRTTTLAEDCVVAKMAKLVEESQNNKSKTQRIIDKCAKYYTPAVVFISTCLAVIPTALRVQNESQWYHLALVVLVSACPCALILSTPVATFCALSMAATSGVLIKGGEYLETLAKIKIMAFDKTGTITRGEFMVTDFQSLLDDVSLNTLLFWVTSIESKSSHPMAAALVEYGQSHSADPKPDKVEEFENFPGEGIYGKIDGKDIYVGNRKIALRAGCETVPTLEGDTKEGKSIGYIFTGATPAGIFSLSDVCRTGVKEAIQELKSIGIKTAMLTGDSDAAAMHAQSQLGCALDVVYAELLPEGKVRIIKDFQKEAPTAMIGDGLNDAPALATADIGISMGVSGSALATETGNVVLMSNDIRKIPKAARLARRTRRKVIENVVLSITTKVAILALAFSGHPLVWAAVLADVGTALMVIFNSMLLLQGNHTHGTKCCKSSATTHVHKHCNSTDRSHSSHSHKHCCSDTKAQTLCEAQKCSSQEATPSSCGNSKYSDSSVKHRTKCCKSSANTHVHKHCNSTDRSHSSHSHKHCCSDTKAQTLCEAQKCSSQEGTPSSCGDSKYSDSSVKHGCCANGDLLQEAKPSDHERCDMDNHGCSGPLMSRSCGESNCTNTVERHSVCAHGDGLHEAKHSDHRNCNTLALHDMASRSEHNHLDVNSLEKGEHLTSNGHCHLIHCVDNHVQNHTTNEELGNVVETSCRHCLPKWEGHSECEKNGTYSGTPLDGTKHWECTAAKDCMSLEKRQIGGCCKSYREECCGKSAHFGPKLGGLSEIIIE